MGSYIKSVSSDEGNSLVPLKSSVRPFDRFCDQNKIGSNTDHRDEQPHTFSVSDLYRFSKIPVTDPRLQFLRAQNKPPEETRVLKKTLLERLIDQYENAN